MRLQHFVRVAVLVVAANLTAACATVRHIGQAQDAFNSAASAELSPSGGETLAQRAEPTYRIAHGLVAKEIAKNEADLRSDGLLGMAYTLKALCEWRMADLNSDLTEKGKEAEETATLALDVMKEDPTLGTRDRVLLRAIPSVLDIVRGRLSTEPYEKPETGPKACFAGAVQGLGELLDDSTVPANHQVRTWLHLSRLRACERWLGAVGMLTDEQIDTETEVVWAAWEECVAKMRPLLAGDGALKTAVQQSGWTMGIPKERINTAMSRTSTMVPPRGTSTAFTSALTGAFVGAR